MTLDEIIAELKDYNGVFPRAGVEAAVREREAITPHLLQALDEAVDWEPDVASENWHLPIYALYLLAQFRETPAYPRVVAICKMPHEALDRLLGDTLTEGLDRILASVFDGDPALIKSVIENPDADEYARSAALSALAILALEDIFPRTELIAYLGDLLRGGLEREYSNAWNELVRVVSDLHAVELGDDCLAAYEEGLIDPGMIHPDDLGEVFSKPADKVLTAAREQRGGLIDNTVHEMQWWAAFRQEKPGKMKGLNTADRAFARRIQKANKEKRPAHPPDRAAKKIGRNAPCPCGSGKKYKKCCLAKAVGR